MPFAQIPRKPRQSEPKLSILLNSPLFVGNRFSALYGLPLGNRLATSSALQSQDMVCTQI